MGAYNQYGMLIVPTGISSIDSAYNLSNSVNQQVQSAQTISNQNNSFNASEAEKQRNFERSLFNQGNAFNAAEAAKNRNWQETMSNTAHQREIADLQAAGLNPVLSATGGNGAAVTSGSAASSLGAPSGAHATADTSANAAIAQIFGSLMNYKTQTDAMKVSAESAARIAEIQAATQRYVSDQSAEASRYASAASMYNAALNAASNQAISAAQLRQQQSLAEYDFEKQMQYRKYDRETQQKNYDWQLYNSEYMALNYPSTYTQAAAASGKKIALAQENTTRGILNGVTNWFNNLKSVYKDYRTGKFNY